MKPIGHQIIHLPTIDSTNNYTANLIRSGEISHGSVIMADEQTNGRGQRGTSWQSTTGENLTASIFLEFNDFSVLDQVSINHWVTFALKQTFTRFELNAKIKWPNDIYIGDRKICGILIENTVGSSGIKNSIIGIGVNVNQLNFDAPNATSVAIESGDVVDVRFLLKELLNNLNHLYPYLLNDRAYLLAEFHANMWRINESVAYREGNDKFNGIIRGTNEFGQLLMEIDSQVKVFNLKEIRFL